MKQEDKELLLKDLCGRLPYKVKVTTASAAVKFGIISGISIENKISVRTKHADIVFNCTEVKPYLFPLSSMTEEESNKFQQLNAECDNMPTFDYISIEHYRIFDWLNKNHFDYRGLIEKGLAIDATDLDFIEV